MAISVKVDVNDKTFGQRVDLYVVRLDEMMRDVANDALTVVHRNVAIELTRKTHPLGTPTPSIPPEPPALVTGNLRRSAQDRMPQRLARGLWEAALRMTAIYARIQELGGWAGRNHSSHLPARPYIAPAVAASPRAIRRRALARLRTLFPR